MNALEKVLWSFEREGLEEISLTSGSEPQAKRGALIEVLEGGAWDTDALLGALVAFGGSRHVEELSDVPRQWTARVAGLGVIAVSATQRGDEVEARFKLLRHDGKSVPPPPPDANGKDSRDPARAAGRPLAPPSPSLSIANGPPPFSTTRLPHQRFNPPPPSEPPPSSARAARRPVDTPTKLQAHAALHELSLPLGGSPDALAEPSFELDLPPPVPARPGVAPPVKSLRNADIVTQPQTFAEKAGARPSPSIAPPAPPPPPASLETLIANSRDAKASDLHLIAGRPPLYRVAGELRGNGPVIAAEHLERIVMPLVPERLRAVLDEQGSCDFALDDRTHGRFRVNVSRQQTGLKACLRLVSRELPTVESLRLPDGIGAAAHHHQGLIVFTGPTGHGKTTTMNAVVDLINRTTSHHIITVEDPVEHLHAKKSALMSQREVGTHTKSFASALKGSLREDPDVIVVGELRDVETVRMAVSASETGHLVLGTMNTPSAARTIDRLVDLFPPGDQPQIRLTLAAGLRLIVSQRLVPGKDGRSMHAAFEILPGSVPLSALIRDNKTFQIPSLQQRGKALGIVRLDDSLARLVVDERITLETAKSISESPGELDTAIKALRASPRGASDR